VANTLKLLRIGAVDFIDWLDLWGLIFLNLRKQILPHDSAESDVRNRNSDHKAHDLENPSQFWQRHAASAKKRREEAADDDTNQSTANRSDEKKQKPCFEVIEFSGLFHGRTLMGSNEKEISHGRVSWQTP
jgi:hypothetical protein